MTTGRPRRSHAGFACAATVMSIAASAPSAGLAAESYPSQSVRFIVTFPPGGGLDLVARVVAQSLTERWAQQVIVDNRIGAGGTIGTALAAKAAPNGYTLLFVSSSHAINPAVHRSLPYDTERDFEPITLTTRVPHLLVVHPSFPVKALKELIALAKARPGAISYASGGVGSSTHLAGELFKSMAGVDIVHVPYKGTGPAVTDAISGQVPMTISSVPSVIAHVRAGRLKALGVTAATRTSTAPEYPPIADAVPGYEASSWHGALVPRGTPATLVARLQRDIASVLTSDSVRERLGREGLDIAASSPEQFREQISKELQRWTRVVKAAGIPVE